ncbi:hypothetical protein ACVIJU_003717 [Aeribacillus sp. SP014]
MKDKNNGIKFVHVLIEAMKSNKKQLYVLNVRYKTFEEPNSEREHKKSPS